MSHAKNLFTAVASTFTSMRRTGTTTVLGIAAPKHGLLIVAGNTQDARRIMAGEELTPRHVTSLTDVEQGRVLGRQQPIVLDNFAVLRLCETAMQQFDKDAEDIARMNREWNKQNREYDGKLQKLGAELYESKDRLQVKDIQIDTYERELLALKTKLNARKLTHIRITRKRRR